MWNSVSLFGGLSFRTGTSNSGYSNATERMEIKSDGQINIKGNELTLDADADTSITADTDDQIDFKVGGTDKMTLTSAGNLQIGGAVNVTTGSSGASANSVVDDLVVQGSGRSGISILTPDANDGQLVFGSPSDNIGAFISYKQSTATMEIGTSLSSGVVKFNSGDGSLAMTLNASGNLVFASNKGIDFANASAGTGGAGTDPAETSTATVLNDYEEGTFTPTSNSVSGGTITQVGMYVKVGNVVTVSVRFTPSGSSTNGHQFGIHLPFKAGTTQSSGSFNTWFGSGMFSSANGNGQHRIWSLGGDGNYVNIRQQGTSSSSEITGNSMTGNFNMSFSITYQTID